MVSISWHFWLLSMLDEKHTQGYFAVLTIDERVQAGAKDCDSTMQWTRMLQGLANPAVHTAFSIPQERGVCLNVAKMLRHPESRVEIWNQQWPFK